MASRHVALLRGVNNIGMTRRVSMATLRDLFEDLGFRDVRTLYNSGNVVFSVPGNRRGDVRGRIQKALAARLGLASPVIMLSADEVEKAVRSNPLADVADNPSWLLVMVLREPSDRSRLRSLLKQRWTPEKLAVGRRVAYIWCAKGIPGSPLWAAVDHALERSGTVRNIRTMERLMNLCEVGKESR